MSGPARTVVQRRRLGNERGARLAESEALAAITAAAGSTLDLREGLRRIARELVRVLGADTAAAYMVDAAATTLVPTAAYHVPKEHLATLGAATLPLREQGFYLPLWRERRPVHSDDVATDPRFSHDLFRTVRHQSGLLLPLILDTDVVGVFYVVWWTARRRFTPRELRLLERVTAQVGLLLRNARLYEQVERNQHRLEVLNEVSRRLAAVHEQEEVLSLIVNEAARLLSAEAAGMRLFDGDDLVVGARTDSAAALMVRPRIKAQESLTGRVVSTGKPVIVEDLTQDTTFDPAHKQGAIAHGFHGFVGVPLISQERILGTLNIYTKGSRHFLPDEVALLTALADQAATAIEKARLFREARAREAEATKLYQVTRHLATSLDRERVLDVIVAQMLELTGCDASGIYLFDRERDRLTFRRGLNLDPELTRTVMLRPGEGVGGRAFAERRPLWTPDRDADPTLHYPAGTRSLIAAKAPRAYLAVPIIGRDDVHGVLMEYFFSAHDFTAREIQQVSTLADHAALALENARLFDETRAQQTRLAQIFDSTSDGVVLVSPAGTIEAANRQAGALLGFDADQAVGLGLAEVIAGDRSHSGPDDAQVVSALRMLLEHPDRGGEGDLELRRMGRIIHWIGQPTKDPAGTTVGFTLTLQDVTKERQVAQMKTDFVSFVTHQLRTPLAGIKWMLELAGQEAGVPDEPAANIQDARLAAERLIGLVNDLLDISRLESGKLKVAPEPIRLGDLTRSVLAELVTLLREKGHRFTVEGADDVPPVVADPQLLRQVVMNLTSNAIKYTPPGGDVRIAVNAEPGVVRWAITDSGIGIPQLSQGRLFEKFYRAENASTLETEGTGLGLYLVRLILERFGGHIWCESDEGKGSTFTFTLPVHERG